MSVETLTFGCRLNAYESEVMKAEAEKAGLSDVLVVNTCAVTAEAVRQAKQAIRKARRDHPERKIIVTGCAAQTEARAFGDMTEVDLVIGNADKMKAEAYTPLAFGLALNDKVQVNDIMSVRETAGHMIDAMDGRARAFVQVQNGCDHRCTFCIIPFGRGNSRSLRAQAARSNFSSLPSTRSTSRMPANVAGSVCAAQPVTTIRRSGRSRCSLRMVCRA